MAETGRQTTMNPDTSSAVELALVWQRAASAHDVDRVLALSDENIEVGGPRGSSRGHQVVRDWVARTGITLEPLRVFAHAGAVVLEQRATWNIEGIPASAKVIGAVFRVSHGVVTSVVRYDSLDEALAAAGLGVEHETSG
jgi:hypothetical protein